MHKIKNCPNVICIINLLASRLFPCILVLLWLMNKDTSKRNVSRPLQNKRDNIDIFKYNFHVIVTSSTACS